MFNASYARLQESHVYKTGCLLLWLYRTFPSLCATNCASIESSSSIPATWTILISWGFLAKILIFKRNLISTACSLKPLAESSRFPAKNKVKPASRIPEPDIPANTAICMKFSHNPLQHDHQMYLRRHERTMSVEMARTIVQTRKTTTGTSQASLRSEVCQVQHGGFWGLW